MWVALLSFFFRRIVAAMVPSQVKLSRVERKRRSVIETNGSRDVMERKIW